MLFLFVLPCRATFKVGNAGNFMFNMNDRDANADNFRTVTQMFAEANPDLFVWFREQEHERFKEDVVSYMSIQNGPDALRWFTSTRALQFLDADVYGKPIIRNITDLWHKHNLQATIARSMHSVCQDPADGSFYCVPYSFYHWGLYYRRSLFEKYNLQPPATWSELKELAATLKSHGIAPFVIGTKYLWPAAGWFDYINMRVNGPKHHLDLLVGKVPWASAEIEATLNVWKELIDADFYMPDHHTYSWADKSGGPDAPLPRLRDYRGGMYLMGDFIRGNAGDIDDLDFFQFPKIMVL